MTKMKYIYLLLISVLLFAACSKDDVPGGIDVADDEIAIGYDQKKYELYAVNGNAKYATTRDITADAVDEDKIENLYILLVKSDWSDIKRYYTNSSTFTDDGEWDANGKKVKIKLTQSEAGIRDVYVVANVPETLKTALDDVTTLAGLQSVLVSNNNPWSPNLRTPILMSGFKGEHDFIEKRILGDGIDEPVHLIRALAKIELNVKLSSGFQVVPTTDDNGGLSEYKYRYVNFDTHTYVLKPENKPANLASSSGDSWPNTGSWTPWSNSLDDATPPATGAGYTLDKVGKVTGLRLITYLNERDEIGAKVEIELPRVDDGPLPPPEFGPELYTLPLPEKVERNHWYVYDIEI